MGRRLLGTSLVLLLLILQLQPAWAVHDVVDKQELVAVVPENFPPYYQLDSEGQPAGLAVDTLARLAETAGFRIRYLVKPDWEEAMQALRSGEADLIPNLGITAERSKYFDFTLPLETFGLGLFVRSSNTTIHGVDDLKGKSSAVVSGNAAVKWLANYPQVLPREFDHQEQALFALLSGEVDALVYPENVTWEMASHIGADARIRQAGLPVLEIKRAVAVRKGDSALLESLDHAVREYTSSARYGELYRHWHRTPQLFWTLERMLGYGSGLLSLLLLLALLALWWWHRRSMAALARQLQQSRDELARAQTEFARCEEEAIQAADRHGSE